MFNSCYQNTFVFQSRLLILKFNERLTSEAMKPNESTYDVQSIYSIKSAMSPFTLFQIF